MFDVDILTVNYFNHDIIKIFSENDIVMFTVFATQMEYFHFNESIRIMEEKIGKKKKEYFHSIVNQKNIEGFISVLEAAFPNRKALCKDLKGNAWRILQENLNNLYDCNNSFKPLNFDAIGTVKMDKIISTVKMLK